MVEFVKARLDEDEQTAREALPGPWACQGEPRDVTVYAVPSGVSVAKGWTRDARHIARHDPAHVLAEVAAKRLVLDMYEDACHRAAHGPNADAVAAARVARSTLRGVLAVLTLPYADHPDFREEWAL